jgi:hypothetical protein
LQEIEKAAQEAEEKRKREEESLRIAREQAAKEEENKRKQEEIRKLVEEKAAQEAARIAEEKVAQELARIKAQEEARLKELEKIAQEVEEKRRREEEALKLIREQAAKEEENKRKLEEESKLAEEKAAQEAELKAEREKWRKLAEEEQRAKQKPVSEPTPPTPRSIPQPPQKPAREEVVASKPAPEPVTPGVLPPERMCSGAMIMKALDCLIGGSKEINAAISRATGIKPQDSIHLTETLIFKSLFGKDNFSTIGDLIGEQFSAEKLTDYFTQIKQITDIGLDMTKIISNLFTETKGVKLHFTDGTIIHLDGQLHSTWPGTRFPDDFSNITLDLKNKLNKYFLQGEPLVLFSPPGYDILPKDFFNLILNMSSKENYPDSLSLFDNKLEEQESIP